ncbi:aldo/keto reductase [Sphingobacterium hungaricum]|uniref:NADP-dependent oxidoreductase domain-containing protein n=1 Tax=Sphingobacterium hungaricum TaxID=2082723 RepID=A0A928UVB0_9SPHI|nr:aldo/keto reductase [Sphingobacterium hungaricum]MBE8713875.1 hypothetical protein [Sphingobacterium hungaricum]
MSTFYDKIRNKEIAPIGLGTWNMGDDLRKQDDEIQALRHGLDLGISIIDTAEMYGNGRSEKVVGEAIKGRREEVYLVSKVLPSNANFDGTIRACERSLSFLQTDYLDLYLLHWQGRYPFQETIDAMEELKNQQKIKAWGVSNMDVSEMQEILGSTSGSSCETNQVLYNLSRRGIEYDLKPFHDQQKIVTMAYSPIEQGRILTNKTLQGIADKHQVSAAQIALAWVLSHQNVVPIPKSASANRVEENFNSLKIELDQEDVEKLDLAFPPPTRKVSLEMI